MIKRLGLHNFKSAMNVDVAFDPLTVLIGKSGTGKTNIVEGIRFWRDFLLTRDLRRYQTQWGSILCASAKEKNFGIQVEFDVPGTAGDFVYGLIYERPATPQHAPTFAKEKLSLAGKVIFAQEKGQWIEPPAIVDVPQPGQPLLGNLYGVPEAKLAYLALAHGIGCYDFPGAVLTAKDLPAARNGQGLSDHAENYLEVYQTIGNALSAPQSREITAALRQLNPTIATLDVETRQRNTIFVGQRTAQGKALTLELSQQSEGFRRFLAHLLALYQIPSKPTLIFEEAEKGIYPGALAALADHFKAVAGQGASQVILTTHSPQLLDYFPVESIRVVEMEDYQTRVGPLATEQVKAVRQNLLDAGELLTADPARLAETT